MSCTIMRVVHARRRVVYAREGGIVPHVVHACVVNPKAHCILATAVAGLALLRWPLCRWVIAVIVRVQEMGALHELGQVRWG